MTSVPRGTTEGDFNNKLKKSKKRQNRLRTAKPDERIKIIDHFGTVDFDPTYDYKAERRCKRK